MTLKNDRMLYLKGAVNLLKSLEIGAGQGLIVLNSENVQEFSDYVLEAAKHEKIENIVNIVLPDYFRPVMKIPYLLAAAVKKAKGLIYIVNRLAEENFTFNRPLQDLCTENKCRYVYIYDPKKQYLKEGIAADYNKVCKKAKKIKTILEDSRELTITSELGTKLSFSLYTHNILARSPLFNQGLYWNQAPEGEVMTCPVEKTFNGRFVVDGVVTGMGAPSKPITWEFKDGVVIKVEGNEKFLSELLMMLKKSDSRVKSLEGMWIAELSIGSNDWAVFDDNISNCEKVSGGVHFAMGNSEGLGMDRGERYHFDNIVTAPTIAITRKNGEKVNLIRSGKLALWF